MHAGQQVEVTSKSGMKMILEAAGEDNEGNQLWRQVSPSLKSFWDQWTQTTIADIERDTYGTKRRSKPI